MSHPTPLSLAVGYLLIHQDESDKGFPRSVRSLLRDVRTVLYAVSLVSGEYHVNAESVAEWGHFPFWACLLSVRRQASAVWQVPTHDASSTPSLSLSIVACSGRRRLRLAVYSLFPLALRRAFTKHTT